MYAICYAHKHNINSSAIHMARIHIVAIQTLKGNLAIHMQPSQFLSLLSILYLG